MKNQVLAFATAGFALFALSLAACAPKSEGGGVDMSIMMKAKEDMDEIKNGFQALKGDLAKFGDRLDQIESAVKNIKPPTSGGEQLTALVGELKGIRTELTQQSQRIEKLANQAAVAAAPPTPKEKDADKLPFSPEATPTKPAEPKTADTKPAKPAETKTSEPRSNPAGLPASEKVSVDLSTPGSKSSEPAKGDSNASGPLPFNEKVKVDLTK